MDLVKLTQTEVVDMIPDLGLRVVDHAESAYFGDAYVVLEAGDLRIRIHSERLRYVVSFASRVDDANWFATAVIMEVLGLSDDASGGVQGTDPIRVLRGLTGLLRAAGAELLTQFDAERFGSSKQVLERMEKSQADRRWGGLELD